MTKTDLQWLSHFLRRVVVHSQDEINALWYLVSKIEAMQSSKPSDCIRQMGAANDAAISGAPVGDLQKL